MKAIWIFYAIEILVLVLLKPLIVNFEVAGIVVVLIHIIFTLLALMMKKKHIREPFLIAFILRALAVFWDLYASHIYSFPNSGADTELFYNKAVLISENLSLLGTTRGGIYSDINGLLFYLIGPQRIVGQYLNVLLGMTTIYIILKSLSLLKIDYKYIRLAAFILALYPNAIIFSAIFLREMFPTFFVAVSIYHFIKWFKSNKTKYIISSFVFLALASAFHAGVFGIIVGYTYAFLFYDQKMHKFKFNSRTILSFILLLILFYFSFTVLDDLIFLKFAYAKSIEDIYNVATSGGRGGAAYLTSLEVTNFRSFLLYSPIKTIYFLLSPLPWNWRGINDIFAFFFDSLLYGTVMLSYFINIKSEKDIMPLTHIFFWMILGGIFVFGVGVSNAGTAMRHRHKLLPLFIIMGTLLIKEKQTSTENEQTI